MPVRPLAGLSTPIDIEFSDGEFAGGLQFAAKKERWNVLAEVMYLDADGRTPNAMGMSTKSEIEQWLIEADLSYQISRDGPLELLGGLRYNRMDNSIAVSGGPSDDGRQAWLDPVLGARLVTDLGEQWNFSWRLDFAGFRGGSNSWNTVVGLHYRPSELLSYNLALRILDIDYERSDFEYDAQTTGVILGVGFHW